MSRKHTQATVRNSIAIEEKIIATKVEKNHKKMSQHSKECCNKVENLETKIFVVAKEHYVSTKDEKKENKRLLRHSVFYVASFLTYVGT